MSNPVEVIPRPNGAPTTDLVPTAASAELARFMPVMSMEVALDRRETIVVAFTKLMKDELDYGKIPGGQKPTLLQPGAQKLDNLFGLVPRFNVEERTEDWTGEDHGGEPFFRYLVRCQVMRGDFVMGEAIGECNSFEAKYRYRIAERVCPDCGRDTIIKTKKKSWWCAKFKGGCNSGFAENDERITGQETGRKINPEIFDQVNTLLKMAQKRAHVAATINATSASEFFTQDMEDRREYRENIDAGGHPAGTQAAQDHVRDTKLAALAPQPAPATPTPNSGAGSGSGPAGVPPSPAAAPPALIPEELQLVFANLVKPGGTAEAFKMLRAELNEALPTAGAIEYERIGAKHGMKARGGKPLSQVRACLLEMWTLAQWARQQTAQASEHVQPGQDDMGFAQEVPYGVD